MDDKAIIDVLIRLRVIAEMKGWIAERENLLTSLFGSHYQKEYTDWNDFESAVANFERILEFFGITGIHPKTREIMLSGTQYSEKELMKKRFEEVWMSSFPNTITQTLEISDDVDAVQLKELRSSLETALSAMKGLATNYDIIRKYRERESEYEIYFENLSKLVRWQQIQKQMEAQSENLKENFFFLFSGVETDWDRILSSLSWMNDLKEGQSETRFAAGFH